MNAGAAWARFGDGRWHFQHGPIDLVIGVDGDAAAVGLALASAWARFAGVLDELVGELRLLERGAFELLGRQRCGGEQLLLARAALRRSGGALRRHAIDGCAMGANYVTVVGHPEPPSPIETHFAAGSNIFARFSHLTYIQYIAYSQL